MSWNTSCMQQHIDEVLRTVNDLRLSGADVTDEDIVIYSLMSFSPEYDIINATTENQHNENISLDVVLQRLLNAKALKGV